MAVEAKQREWIWEFFLKNCTDARMIQELMNALPFPDENLDLKKMLLLRSLSLQISAGIIDELTLDILRGLGELNRVTEARRERCSASCYCQEVTEKRKLREDEKNADAVAVSIEGTTSSSPQVTGGRVLPGIFEQRRESNKDARKAETVVGIRDWMKGRALPRSVCGSGIPEEQLKDKGVSNSGKVGTLSGLRELLGNEFVFGPGQCAKQWELELAVMVELAVKHLRGDSPDRKLFEHAVTKYWGDIMDDTDALSAADREEMVRARDQIKSELWMVRKKPELLDDVVEKYTKDQVEDTLKTHLKKAWAGTGQTFLDRVSIDVVNGKYNPVNCNSQRPPKKAGSPFEDGEVGREGNRKEQTNEKPWIRASRGRYSKSREKLQKNFAIWDLDDNEEGGVAAKVPVDERCREGGEIRAEQHVGGESNGQDGGPTGEDRVNVNNTSREDGETRVGEGVSEGGLGIDARSHKFGMSVIDGGVARVLDFEESVNEEIVVGKQHCEEVQEAVRADTEATEADGQMHRRQDTAAVSREGLFEDRTECSPTSCAVDTTRVPGVSIVNSNVIDHSGGGETLTTNDEKRSEEASNAKSTNLPEAEPGCPHEETFDKENVVPSSSSKPVDPNQNPVCFSPPPWVAGSPAVPATAGGGPGLTRKRKSGLITEETGAATQREESRNPETDAATNCTSQDPDTLTTQRNLRRKQTVLDAVLQDPLPQILTTSRALSNLLERNATARTLEWEEDDDIEESQPSSPSGSRHVRLPHPVKGHRISPLAGTKTAQVNGSVNARQARRKPRRWSEKEVESLKEEVGKFGKGRWKLILEKNLDTFQGRTEVDLKDKWRNLERFEGITD